MAYFHQPVLLKEVLEYLNPQPNKNFIDCTVGGGGHAKEILKMISPRGKLLGIDRDPAAIVAAKENLNEFKNRLILIQDSYNNIANIIYGQRLFLRPSGILLDLGVSSYQVSAFDQRGFSFQQKDSPLDMRFGPDGRLTAKDVVNHYSEKDLAEIFYKYGEEEKAKQIARQIVLQRKKSPFNTTAELLEVIDRVKKYQASRIHPATKVFQALRIEVNQELDILRKILPQLIDILSPRGRLAVISFHSLEDRIVKQIFNQESRDCLCPKEIPICVCRHKKNINLINKKVITPSEKEIKSNPRCRSAKLRVVEKI